MPTFGKASRNRLDTCHPDLVRLCERAIQDWDFSVLCGHRGREEQERAYREGKSKARWGESPHNSYPSRAVDLWPYPIRWVDTDRARVFAGYLLGLAAAMGIRLRWGGDWHGELRTNSSDERRHSFEDLPHFELVED